MVSEEKTNSLTEVYRLSLTHYIDDGENMYRLEEPLIVQMIFGKPFMPQAICLNHMIDMMKAELLRRAGDIE